MRSLVVIALLLTFVNLSFSAPTLENGVSESITDETAANSETVEPVQLLDVADAGASHAGEADRNARFIGFGYGGYGGFGYRPWGYRPWGYRPWGYRPWGYRPYGYGYGYRRWGYGGYGGYGYGFYG